MTKRLVRLARPDSVETLPYISFVAMPNPPLLSFCIFTYNRAFLLTQLLDQLVQIKNAFPPGVIEVVISDNASTDATAAIVGERYRDHEFKLVVQERHIGITQNWLRAMQESSGTYIWSYADDDLFDIPAVIDMIVNHLQHRTADFYHVNHAQGIYTDTPRRSAVMGQIHHGLDCDIIFPDMASMIPYCGVVLRGILVLGNIFRGNAISGHDFSDCFALDDMIENAAVLLKAFKNSKCALLHKCSMIHIHPPEPRWFGDAKNGLPGRYILTFSLIRRMIDLAKNGTIAPRMIEDDGFLWVEKQGSQYLTIRKTLPHVLYPDILDVIKKIGHPMEARDSEILNDFAGYLSDPAMKLVFAGLSQFAATQSPEISARLEKLRPQINNSGRVVMWQADSCPPYDRYVGQTLDLSRLGAHDI